MKQLCIAISLLITFSCFAMKNVPLNVIRARSTASFFEALILDKGWVDQPQELFIFPDCADDTKEYAFSSSAMKVVMEKMEKFIKNGPSTTQKNLLANSKYKLNTCPDRLDSEDLLRIQADRFANFSMGKNDEFERKRLQDVIEEQKNKVNI